MMDEQLSNKVALVTGATGALGRAVTQVFAAQGVRLALAGRSMDKLTALVEEIGLPEECAFAVTGDLTQEEDVNAIVGAIAARFGTVDVLLNIAGGWSGGKPVHETPVEAWDWALNLNLRSAFLISRAVLPYMLDQGWGRVIHVGSKTAVAPKAKQAGYAVSKMGLITLTEVIAAEVKGTGVTANVVLPSIIDTPANRRMMSKADPGRWVPPEHIAQTMAFLCTEEAASINGDRVPIYGAV
jgi:NAD(P)-dependent dehydrogenase (short-subunit alcohol dehydrogenase family)